MTGTAAASRRTPPLPLGIFSLYQHFFFFVSFFHHSPLAINHNSTAGFRSNVSYTLLFYFYFFFSFFLLIPSVLQPAHTRLCTWQKKKENINKYWFFFGGEGGGGWWEQKECGMVLLSYESLGFYWLRSTPNYTLRFVLPSTIEDQWLTLWSSFKSFIWFRFEKLQVADAGREPARRGTTSHPAAKRRTATEQGADCESWAWETARNRELHHQVNLLTFWNTFYFFFVAFLLSFYLASFFSVILIICLFFSYQIASGRKRSGADSGRVRQAARADGTAPWWAFGSTAEALRSGNEPSGGSGRTSTNERSCETRARAMGRWERLW